MSMDRIRREVEDDSLINVFADFPEITKSIKLKW